jgi:hypothetical protein
MASTTIATARWMTAATRFAAVDSIALELRNVCNATPVNRVRAALARCVQPRAPAPRSRTTSRIQQAVPAHVVPARTAAAVPQMSAQILAMTVRQQRQDQRNNASMASAMAAEGVQSRIR